jgi:hypothetical protein
MTSSITRGRWWPKLTSWPAGGRFAAPADFIEAMWEQHKVRLGSPYPSGHLRLVMHYYITDADVKHIAQAFKQLLA